jgi:hypothetical protein
VRERKGHLLLAPPLGVQILLPRNQLVAALHVLLPLGLELRVGLVRARRHVGDVDRRANVAAAAAATAALLLVVAARVVVRRVATARVAAVLVLVVVVLARRLVLVLGPRRVQPRLAEREPDALALLRGDRLQPAAPLRARMCRWRGNNRNAKIRCGDRKNYYII